MEEFGTITVRLYIMLPAGKYTRTKAVVLHRFHGRKGECLEKYARFVKANRRFDGELNATWEVREAIHLDDLPRDLPEEDETI